ncbi:DNA translocase FtsK [uncultured Lamprocystis sp.]|jgi:S-DNA-T family DNA segregation ATPase FtsK/SpoIIIE|uniref:DNA translocase FtsK n=1 Tax=uncultured Lamprocystis sp. TaxID=543132 RepID=UPI0025CF9C5D|nr:DNA translocase FtsK [uncultured Lamprocystis sp.]
MAQATRSGQLNFSDYVERALREGAMWTLMCVALYLVLSLVTYVPEDPGWSYVGETSRISNAGGRTGAWFADVSLYLFGYFAYLVPLMVAFSAWVLFRGPEEEGAPRVWMLALRWSGFLLTLAAGCGFATMHFIALGTGLPNGSGGGLGHAVSGLMAERFGAGTEVLLAGVLLVGFTLFSGISWFALIESLGDGLLQGLRSLGSGVAGGVSALARRRSESVPTELPKDLRLIDAADLAPTRAVADESAGWDWQQSEPVDHAARSQQRASGAEPLSEPLSEPVLDRESAGPDVPAHDAAIDVSSAPNAAVREPESESEQILTLTDLIKGQRPVPKDAPRLQTVRRTMAVAERPVALSGSAPVPTGEGRRPPLDLLDPARKTGKGYTDEQIEALSRLVEVRLKDFGVQVEVVAAYPGPVVTLLELQLAPGTKSSKILGLSKDLARALSKISVRVVEVIPGKSVIGIEIPNEKRETVFLSEILGSADYLESKSPLTLALGHNISGLPVSVDLARMPHALIAGTTGSGKSVAINAMILSLVYKAGPEDVRLIMVDPKMLELSVYEGIPHLLTPVVTDMKEAANALRWCVGEMERRYRLMAALGVRNIGGYNRKVADAEAAGEPLRDPVLAAEFAKNPGMEVAVPTIGHLPYIVVIIDELADMMMVVGKKVEELIARLAQKARASGIHLMLATQRPSVDVLTGLIKANIPTRISFQVSSRIDSRTVLDQMGAEQLLGHGDMLYLPPGGNIPQRVHGAFVDDHEVHRVVEFLKTQGAPDYIEDILRESQESLPGIDPEPRGDVEDSDPLFDEAVQIVVESRRASISGVQRRLKIGYNRAARMIEEMERIGIVGPPETNGNREVLAPPVVHED